MKKSLTINGTAYDANARAQTGFLGLESLKLSLDGYDALAFSVNSCGTSMPFPPGSTVTLTTTNDDGSNSQVRFTGDLLRPRFTCPAGSGPIWTYQAGDLKRRGDRVPIRDPNGTGTALFNLSPSDDFYVQAKAGRTVGQIVQAILQGKKTQGQLAALGIGNYASGGFLPAQTQTDLGLLNIIPYNPVRLRGPGLFAQLGEFIAQYHPRALLRVEPTGLIRVYDLLNLPTRTLTFPGNAGQGDPIDPPDFDVNLEGCYSYYQVQGLDIGVWNGDLLDGTMVSASAPADVSAWTLADFTTPTQSADTGTISGVGATGCTYVSDNPASKWDANYLQTIGAVIYLNDSKNGQLFNVSDWRVITGCTQLSPGGSAQITWDSSQPLNYAGYNKARVQGRNTPRAEVGRRFLVREPATGNTGLNTAIGPALFPKFPAAVWFAHLSGLTQVTTPTAFVSTSLNNNGKAPFVETPIGIQIDPTTGTILLDRPAAACSATQDMLMRGYPASELLGAPHNVRVCVPYVRGELNVISPAGGVPVGTAFTKYGQSYVYADPADEFLYSGDSTFWQKYADEQLLTLQDAVIDGGIVAHDLPAGFDPMVMGYAIQLQAPFSPADLHPDLKGVKLPVREVEISWPNSGPDLVTVAWRFNNGRPRTVSANFGTHPAFTDGAAGSSYLDGETLYAGSANFASGLGPVAIEAGTQIGAGAQIGPAATIAATVAIPQVSYQDPGYDGSGGMNDFRAGREGYTSQADRRAHEHDEKNRLARLAMPKTPVEPGLTRGALSDDDLNDMLGAE